MNELVFILPQFIVACLFGYLAFKFSVKENKNVAFQMLFFILMLGFLVFGFVNQTELATIQNATDSTYGNMVLLVNGSYWGIIITTMITLGLLLVFLLWDYFSKFSELAPTKKWDRIKHKEM